MSLRKALDAKSIELQRSKDESKKIKSEREAVTQAEKERHRVQIEGLESKFRGDKQEIMASHQKMLGFKHSELQRSLERINRITFESHTALKTAQAEAERAQQAAEVTYKEHVQNLLDAHEGVLASMNVKFEESMTALRVDRDQQMLAASVNLKGVVGDHKRLLGELKATHENEIFWLTRQMEEQEQEISERYETTFKRIRRENEQLSDNLLARDSAPGGLFQFQSPESTDDDIKRKYVTIQDLINDLVNPLSKLSWRTDRAVWIDSLMNRLEASTKQNQRLLKNAILKDAIWSILFREIFCSPFRTLGEEGETFEIEWNRYCGVDESSAAGLYVWPPPEPETERWRYLTIKECREALSRKVSSVDPRARLKMSFKSSWDALTAESEATISTVVNADACDLEAIENLGRKASAMCLDFQMHRCRLEFDLEESGPQSLEEKSEMALHGSLTLTLQPVLKRHGNVKGLDFATSKVICEGKTMSLA